MVPMIMKIEDDDDEEDNDDNDVDDLSPRRVENEEANFMC